MSICGGSTPFDTKMQDDDILANLFSPAKIFTEENEDSFGLV